LPSGTFDDVDMMRHAVSFVVVGVAIVFGGCDGCGRSGAVVDAGVTVDGDDDGDEVFALSPAERDDPVGAVVAAMGSRPGACAQVRSINTLEEAESVAQAIRQATSLAVELIAKDLGDKGVWQRLCVGDEDNEGRLIAQATRWTSPGGLLAPFLDPPRTPDEPRFHVLEKARSDVRRPTPAQAAAFLARRPTPPFFFVGSGAAPALVGTAGVGESAGSGHARVVAVDAAGALLRLDPAQPPGCASCAVFEAQSPVVSRRVLGAGDVHPAPGVELLVEEETAQHARTLAIVSADGGVMRRVGAVLLAAASVDVVTRGEAAVVEADGDDDREVAVTRLELTALEGQLCRLQTKAEVWGASPEAARGFGRIDLKTVQSGGGDAAVVDYVTALDAANDADAGSRACGDALRDAPGTLTMQLCLQRIRALVGRGDLVAAVNAAGHLAERAPALRGAVAGPLFAAMSALDADPRLSAAPYDCVAAPLVADMKSKSIDDTIKLARVRLSERLSLSDVNDAVFVTAARDFGNDTPVFGIAARWLERLRVTQPARHAAIEAALLPQAPPPAGAVDGGFGDTPPPTATNSDGTPGFGGTP
jgi:hypothetical protein